MKKNSIIKMLLVSTIALFTIPLIVNYIIKTPSKFGFINEVNISAWISFYGSVVGGLLTLFGVVYTINKQDEFNKLDKIAQDDLNEKNAIMEYFPNFNFSHSSEIIDSKSFAELRVSQGVCDEFAGFIIIKNVGTNNAKNLRIQCINKNEDYKSELISLNNGYVVRNEEYYIKLFLKSLSDFRPILIDLNVYFEDSICHEYKICFECEIIRTNDNWQLSFLESNKYEAVLIRTRFVPKESIESTDYEHCHNKFKFDQYDQMFYDQFLKNRLNSINTIIFKKLYGEYNSGSMSFPIEIKLINENKCRHIVQTEFGFHGKIVFVYKYEIIIDLFNKCVCFQKFRIIKNLNICNGIKVIILYLMGHKKTKYFKES